jgi:hypothetical protein
MMDPSMVEVEPRIVRLLGNHVEFKEILQERDPGVRLDIVDKFFRDEFQDGSEGIAELKKGYKKSWMPQKISMLFGDNHLTFSSCRSNFQEKLAK